MAVSVRRAESLVAAVRSSGARLMVGYMKRYDAGNLLLKKHLDAWRTSGECGRLVLARNHGFGGSWLYGMDGNIPVSKSDAPAPPAPDECPEWLPKEWQSGYLGFLQQWTHNINLLRFFLDDTGGKSRLVHTDLDKDGMTGVTTFEINGTRAILESGYTKFHGWDEHTQIYFDGGLAQNASAAPGPKRSPRFGGSLPLRK